VIDAAPMDTPSSPSVERLAQLAEEIGDLQSKLILLVGRSGKTKLLRMLAQRLNAPLFNIGVKLGRRLAATPLSERSFSTNELLRESIDSACGDVPLLLDNLEVLFEPSLKINPLDIIKRVAHSRRVVAVWPGEMRNDRLMYAGMGHPEHRDYTRDGVVVFELAQSQ
jgi:hypothetical protein